LFLEANVLVFQWLLIGFEQLSDMNINFSKCELIPFNISSTHGIELASKLGCTLSSLPIAYLGLPSHSKKLNSSD
jgi:hypothetical protein